MSRKLITVLLTALTVLILTGCNGDKKAVTETAEGFLNAIVNNDMDAAAQYATEDFMNSKTMKLMDPDYLAETFYTAMGVQKEDMDEEAQKVVDEYVGRVVDKAYKSFEIQDIKVQENKAGVTAKITLGYDPESSSKLSDDTRAMIKDYQSEHYDELIAIYTDEGESAMYKKIYNDLIPIVIGKMQEELESSAPSDEKTILSLEKIDKKWLVTNLEENRPQSASAETTQEAAAAATTSAVTESAADSSTEAAAEDTASGEDAEDGDSSGESTEEGATEGTTEGTTEGADEAVTDGATEGAAEGASEGTTEGETGN